MVGFAHAQITVGGDGGETIDNTTYSGAQSLTKTGSNLVSLTGTNSYSGGTIINGGVLQVLSDAQLGATSGGITFNGGQIFNNTAALEIGASRSVTLEAGGGYLRAGWSQTFTVSGPITGSGGLGVIWDSGTVVLSGSNSYSGTTTIGTVGVANSSYNAVDANPSLMLGSSNALSSGNALTFGSSGNNNTATLNLNGYNATVGATTGSGNAVIDNTAVGAATLTLSLASGSANYGGTIKNTAGAISLVKSGAGTQILSGTSTYTGTTTVSAGTLEIASTGLLGGGSYAGAITNNGSFIAGSNSNQTLSGAISGSGALTKNGTGTMVLNGANTYTGATSVNAGTLRLQGTAFSTTARAYTIASGAVLNIDGDTTVASGTTTLGGSGTLRISGGLLANTVGSGNNVTIALSSGAAIEIESGATMRNGGWQNMTWTNNKGSMNIASGATFDLWDGAAVTVDALTGSGTITKTMVQNSPISLTVGADNGSGIFSGAISNPSGQISLVKTGSGTQTLSGSNTYTGTTTVSAGTLLINGQLGASGQATGLTSVAAAGTLGGKGAVFGDLNFDGGSQFEVVDLTDALSVTGAVTFGNGFGIDNLRGIAWGELELDKAYTVLSTTQTFSAASIGNFGYDNRFAVGGDREAYFTNGSLQVVVIPEPHAALLGGLSLLCLLRRKR